MPGFSLESVFLVWWFW